MFLLAHLKAAVFSQGFMLIKWANILHAIVKTNRNSQVEIAYV